MCQARGDFDKEGLGEAGAMIFTNPSFKDRELVRRLLLTGRSGFPVNACVDNYNVAAVEHGEDAKRKKWIKPPKSQVMQVLKAAFQQFSRLVTFKEQNGEVLFKGWPTSVRGQTLFHNELLMRCCRVSLRQVLQMRAHFHEGRPTPIQPKAKSVAQALAESRMALALLMARFSPPAAACGEAQALVRSALPRMHRARRVAV